MELYHLRTNHLKSPVIDSAPEFSWRIKSDSGNVIQTAYRITVSDDKGVVWDSGRIESDKQGFIQYEGSLKSKTVYHWTVTVWDNQGNEASASDVLKLLFLTSRNGKRRGLKAPCRETKQSFSPTVSKTPLFSLNAALR